MNNQNKILRSLENANKNNTCTYTREGSGVFFTEKGKRSTEVESHPGDNGQTGVKVTRLSNRKLVVIGVIIIVVSLAIIVGATAAIILTREDNEKRTSDSDMTTLPLSYSTQQTTAASTDNANATSTATPDTTSASSSTSDKISTGSAMTGEPLVVTWLPWNAWLSCSVTCGSGFHRRYRSCSDSASICEGDYIETTVCTETSCPVYGKWTTWASWGSCTSSCGGGIQLRTRSCNKTDSSDLECVGNDSQNKTCSNWNCPDCSQNCTSLGKLNPACDTCICENNIVTGRVVSNRNGYFLSNAFVYASTAPTAVLTRTNTTGHFTLNSMCVSTQLLFAREGFVDTTVTIDSNDVEVRMTRIALPYFTQTPMSKYRLTGETVTMCCTAMATPDIDYYEWFKDSLLIETVESTDGTMITLQNLTPSDSGNYQCRANSPNGAVMSPVAKMDVKENPDEFCQNALQQKVVSLPEGCAQQDTNSTLYEVGECVAHSCRLNESNTEDSCKDDTNSCCVMSEVDIRTVQCTDYEIQVFVIRACGCGKCISPSLKISGTAVDFEDNSPVKFAEVWVNGVFQTYTSGSGSFSFKPSTSVDQINIFIVDAFLQQYMSTTKVFKIFPDMTGTLHIEIKLFKASDPVELDSTMENTLVAGTTEGGSAIVQLEIPSNAFNNVDGTPYNDTVLASLTFLDPANSTVLEHMPGLFEFTDAEGQQGALDSYGVFNLYFRGSDGQNLVLNDVVNVYAPSDVGTSDEDQDIKLWRLNSEAGNWDYVTTGSGARRRKRQTLSILIASIDPAEISDIQWWNYDMVRGRRDECYYKVRLFEEETLQTPVTNPSSRVNVESITLSNGNSKMRKIYDYIYNPEERCISAICENASAYISAFNYQSNYKKDMYAAEPYLKLYSTVSFTITDDNKTLIADMIRSTSGPFFEDLDACLKSSQDDPHLRYHYGRTTQDWTALETFTPALTPSNRIQQMKLSRMAWYPKRQEGYRACYLKVRLEFLDSHVFKGLDFSLTLKATSYGGSVETVANQMFGVRTINKQGTENETICIEYKCSGLIDPFFENNDTDIDNTRVKLEFDHPIREMECMITRNTGLDQDTVSHTTATTGGVSEFKARTDGGPSIGTYYATWDDTPLVANENALSTCHTGNVVSGPFEPLIGVGITFTCRPSCDKWWYFNYYYDNC